MVEGRMTANKSSKAAPRATTSKTPQDIPERCQSASPPPVLSAGKALSRPHPLSDSEECCQRGGGGGGYGYVRVSEARLRSLRNPSGKSATLCSDYFSQSRLLKARSISCLDNRLSVYKPARDGDGDKDGDGDGQGAEQGQGQEQAKDPGQKENQLEGSPVGDGLSGGGGQQGWTCPGPAPNHALHQRSLSLTRPVSGSQAVAIRRRISEWECRRGAPPRMSLCLDKRGSLGGLEGQGPLSPTCNETAFNLKATRRASIAFSECSYPETEEEGEGVASDRDRRPSKTDLVLRSFSSRREPSAVLNRIQKIEQTLKESPSHTPPLYPSSCYAPDRVRQRAFTISGHGAASGTHAGKRASVGSFPVGRDASAALGQDGAPKREQRAGPGSPDLSSPESARAMPVNPLPKPKRTFEYECNRSNGLASPSGSLESPPPLPSTPAPSIMRNQGKDGSTHRESCESEDATSLPSSHPSSPTANGMVSTATRTRPSSKSTLEENAYEDIVEALKENPYEDVDLKGRILLRKSRLLSESSRNSLNRMWTPQDRKSSTPPQLPSKPGSQSLRLPGPSDRKCHRASRLSKRHGPDDVLLLPPLGVPSSPCGLLNDGLSGGGDTLGPRCRRRVPKLVQRINSIYCSKRGKKRLKKLSFSNIEPSSLREDNSESESDSDDRFKAHTQRLLKLQSLLRRAPSYRTLELQLIEWQERELFEYFVVVSLKKKPTKNSYTPEVSYQFPKLERPTKQVREAEQRLKAIPQFCFPDAKDWSPVSEYNSETFSFMLTGEDGSRRFGYCRRLLPCGKVPRLPEVYCIISRLGCFDLFSKILDEVERRRGISAALVYPFMRSLMESPFPAPGKTIRVKTFLPGAGNEVMELRRPSDSRLEHVDLESLFSCLSVRQVVRIFASLLLERRVIFVADKLSTLSSCVHAMVALLYPFSWQHTFIPVLPASMVDIVCCPTPFLVGLLSSSLPKLQGLPVEEALMVDLGTDRFIRQMDDEATLLPRKLQAALEQALEHRNDIINPDTDSESDEESNSLSNLVSEAFIRFFLEAIGHYSLFMTQNERGERVFQREAFRKSVASKSVRRFLGVFMESQMFAGFIQDRELRKCRAKGLFEQRVEQYLEELPDTEQSGVNKFLKGLGSKMRFLHKKN
ncbi:DENN domain-containing protein 2B-like isoform X2 [Anguilla rostrata]